MCAPLTPRQTLSLDRLGLDDLGMLARHKRATPAVRDAFVRALRTWIELRVRRVGQGRLQPADIDDLVQDFVVRCLTRHLCAWDPALCTISAFLFRRLRCEVIDHQRVVCRRAARDTIVDEVELLSPEPSPVEREEQQVRERKLRLVDDVVAALPRRQKMVMRRTLLGDTLHDIAKDIGVSHSTLSREKSAALQQIHTALAA